MARHAAISPTGAFAVAGRAAALAGAFAVAGRAAALAGAIAVAGHAAALTGTIAVAGRAAASAACMAAKSGIDCARSTGRPALQGSAAVGVAWVRVTIWMAFLTQLRLIVDIWLEIDCFPPIWRCVRVRFEGFRDDFSCGLIVQ